MTKEWLFENENLGEPVSDFDMGNTGWRFVDHGEFREKRNHMAMRNANADPVAQDMGNRVEPERSKRFRR